jgi:glutamyl-tRNA synthetase
MPLDFPGSALKIQTPDLPVPVWDELRGMIEVDLQEWMPDFVIRRRDGLPSYQVSSLSDDLDFGMNLIVRGEDLLGSTAAQLHLADLLGETAFLNTRFRHHPLIRDAGNRKLSKTERSDSIRALYMDRGNAEGLLRDLSRALGRKDECKNLQELLLR